MTENMPQGKETVSDSEIVDFLQDGDDPFYGTSEVADNFDHTRQWAHNRLQKLHDRGEIEKKSSGRNVIWWS